MGTNIRWRVSLYRWGSFLFRCREDGRTLATRHVQIHYRHLFCNRICYRFATEFFPVTGCYRIFVCSESVENRSNRNILLRSPKWLLFWVIIVIRVFFPKTYVHASQISGVIRKYLKIHFFH